MRSLTRQQSPAQQRAATQAERPARFPRVPAFAATRQHSRLGLVVTVLALLSAGLIHLYLTPEHFQEQVLYGLVFTAIAVFQVLLAFSLVVRPGPRAYRVGIWASGAIALVYVMTRLAPPPGSAAPEEVDALGVAATLLELGALITLALALPEAPPARARGARAVWWGIGGAVLTLPLWLVATGSLQWLGDEQPVGLTWLGQRSAITPALVGSPLPHLWLFVPWWSLLGAAGLAVLVGLNLGVATRLVERGGLSCRGRRVGLLTLVPAAFAAPLCCGAPLAALLGVPLLLRVKVAPLTTLLSLVLLAANLAWLLVRKRREGRAERGEAGEAAADGRPCA